MSGPFFFCAGGYVAVGAVTNELVSGPRGGKLRQFSQFLVFLSFLLCTGQLRSNGNPPEI
jgi:hypothetical protein